MLQMQLAREKVNAYFEAKKKTPSAQSRKQSGKQLEPFWLLVEG